MKGFPYNNLPETQRKEFIRTGNVKKNDEIVLGQIEKLYTKIVDYLKFDPTTMLNFGLEGDHPKYIKEDVDKFLALVEQLVLLKNKYADILKNRNLLRNRMSDDYSATLASEFKLVESLNSQINKCIVSAEENYETYCVLEDEENE